jgi:hypothetical protein
METACIVFGIRLDSDKKLKALENKYHLDVVEKHLFFGCVIGVLIQELENDAFQFEELKAHIKTAKKKFDEIFPDEDGTVWIIGQQN